MCGRIGNEMPRKRKFRHEKVGSIGQKTMETYIPTDGQACVSARQRRRKANQVNVPSVGSKPDRKLGKGKRRNRRGKATIGQIMGHMKFTSLEL